MTSISDLSGATAVTAATNLVGTQGDGGDYRYPVALLQAYMQANLNFASNALVSQYGVPLTGTTVTVATGNTWLILTPAGTLAALTIALPTNRTDKQEVLVNSTQILTALTVSGAGTTVVGAPTTLAANGFFKMRYDGTLNAWYRVG
jgi:hypothetical protein